MKPSKSIFLVILMFSLFSTITFAQDFEDELEAELESELGAGEDEVEPELTETPASESSDDSFTDFEEESENTDFDDSTSDDNLAEENLDDAFSEDDPNAVEDDMDFSEFEEELENDLKGSEEAVGAVPVDESLDDATEELDLEPLDEEPVVDEVVSPESEFNEEPAIVDSYDTEFSEPVADSTPIEEAIGDTGPDLEYEARLYNIYINYHNSPTPEGEWLSMVGSRQSELYPIQSGDTLWGVSEIFFGDGQFWPKIWSINNKIENPHLINEGNQIQFVMGTESDAPMFTVSETPTGPTAGADQDTAAAEKASEEFDLDMQTINELIESGALDAADAEQFKAAVKEKPQSAIEEKTSPKKEKAAVKVANNYVEPDIDIPPPSFISRPVLKTLPPSVPEWQNTNRFGDYDDAGISFVRPKLADLKDEMYLSSYIDDAELISDAAVFEIETGSRIAWENQYVFVRFPIGKAVSGEKYLVLENVGQLEAPNNHIIARNLGYQKVISGMITVGQKIKADVDEKKYEVYRAFVDKAINPLRLGGEVIRGELPLINLNSSGPRSDIVTQIIGGNLDKRRQIFGKSSIVFLDRGIEDGLIEGQVLSIRANRLVRNDESKILENQKVIGHLKVVKAANKFSTAVVTESLEDIYSGDFTGEGRLLPRMIKEQVKKSTEGNDSFSEDLESEDTAFNDDFDEEEGDGELDQLLEDGDENFDEENLDDFEGQSDFE